MLIISLLCGISFGVYTIKYNRNKQESKELLRVAYDQIDGKATERDNSINNEIIGILIIEKLNIEAPIREGTTQEVMRTSIGHFTESDYWNGNVALASHNGGTSMHYFENLNKLNMNDEIIYKTQFGEKKYKVQSIDKIDDTDWSMVNKSDNADENTITLITCINGKPNKRLCVRGIEI